MERKENKIASLKPGFFNSQLPPQQRKGTEASTLQKQSLTQLYGSVSSEYSLVHVLSTTYTDTITHSAKQQYSHSQHGTVLHIPFHEIPPPGYFSVPDPSATTQIKPLLDLLWTKMDGENLGKKIVQKRKQGIHGGKEEEAEGDSVVHSLSQ